MNEKYDIKIKYLCFSNIFTISLFFATNPTIPSSIYNLIIFVPFATLVQISPFLGSIKKTEALSHFKIAQVYSIIFLKAS